MISAARIIRIVGADGATIAAPAKGITAADPAESFDWLKDRSSAPSPSATNVAASAKPPNETCVVLCATIQRDKAAAILVSATSGATLRDPSAPRADGRARSPSLPQGRGCRR